MSISSCLEYLKKWVKMRWEDMIKNLKCEDWIFTKSKASEPYVRPPKQNEKTVQQAFCDKVVRPCRTIHGWTCLSGSKICKFHNWILWSFPPLDCQGSADFQDYPLDSPAWMTKHDAWDHVEQSPCALRAKRLRPLAEPAKTRHSKM